MISRAITPPAAPKASTSASAVGAPATTRLRRLAGGRRHRVDLARSGHGRRDLEAPGSGAWLTNKSRRSAQLARRRFRWRRFWATIAGFPYVAWAFSAQTTLAVCAGFDASQRLPSTGIHKGFHASLRNRRADPPGSKRTSSGHAGALQDLITTNGGKVHRVEDWGRRQLAYQINKLAKAHYLCLNIESQPRKPLVELETGFKFNDAVLRHLTVQKDKAETAPSVMMKQVEREEARKASKNKPLPD